jgi:small nuclear ribonucleoprotein (snRNP)-like protein
LCDSKVNLVLDDAVEFTPDEENAGKFVKKALKCEILLNGNQIAALVPGGAGPEGASISRTEA